MLYSYYYKIIRKIKILIINFSKDKRPSSSPFISGDSFRKIADFIFDEKESFNPELVENGDVVFVKSDLLKKFFETLHKGINKKYILISHNSDQNIDDQYLKYIDPKIIKWFAQNCITKHTQIIPIPIGLENAHYCNAGQTKLFKKILKIKVIKKPKILVSFNLQTNLKVRKEAFDLLSKLPLVDIIYKKTPEEYLKLLQEYMFVASPEGNGVDCHRTWEATYLKTVPILINNRTSDYFKNIGAPILNIESWNELTKLSEQDLTKIYNNIIENSKLEIVSLDYWQNKIYSFKNE